MDIEEFFLGDPSILDVDDSFDLDKALEEATGDWKHEDWIWVYSIDSKLSDGTLQIADIDAIPEDKLMEFISKFKLGVDPSRFESKDLRDAVLVKLSLKEDTKGWFKAPDLRPVEERTPSERAALWAYLKPILGLNPEWLRDLGLADRIESYTELYGSSMLRIHLLYAWAYEHNMV